MKRPVATVREAEAFLTMAARDDISEAARFARGMLGLDQVVQALTSKFEESIKRCDECEREGRKLAKTVATEIDRLKTVVKKLQREIGDLRRLAK